MLVKLNDMGAMLAQVQPIESVAILLAATTALVQSRGTAVYSAEAIQEVANIQQQLAEDLWKQFFMLRQPNEEAVRAEKKAFATDVLENLHLHMVLPSLATPDRRAHPMALEILNDEAQTDPNAALYGKDDVLLLDDWRLRKMNQKKSLTGPDGGDD